MTNAHQSDDALIANEAKFRKRNESVAEKIDELEQMAHKHGQPSLAFNRKQPMQFYCECSDVNCTKRVTLDVRTYESVHKNRKRFVLVPQHQEPRIEHLIKEQSHYVVVEKVKCPPENPPSL